MLARGRRTSRVIFASDAGHRPSRRRTDASRSPPARPSGSSASPGPASPRPRWPMMGLLPSYARRHRVDQAPRSRAHRAARRRRCARSAAARSPMVFQDALAALNPVVTRRRAARRGRAACTVPAPRAAERRARAIELLEIVGIPSPDQRVDRYPHEFSGGMRQRVMIAMGVANEPELLIADEPTTALDVTVQAQILEVLREVQAATGTAIVLITHDLGRRRRRRRPRPGDVRRRARRERPTSSSRSTSRPPLHRRASSPPSRGWTAAAHATSGSTRSRDSRPIATALARPAAGSRRAAHYFEAELCAAVVPADRSRVGPGHVAACRVRVERVSGGTRMS